MEQNQIDQGIRLKKLIKALNLNQSTFANSLGMTQANISKMTIGAGKVSSEVLNRITIHYKEVNMHWLLTGDGMMFLDEGAKGAVQEPAPKYKGRGRLEELEARVEQLEETVRRLKKDLNK